MPILPILPMQPGLVERRSHDYVRHGTTTLFAALEIATGKVTATVKPRHRHQEFLAFLKQVERGYRHVLDQEGNPFIELMLGIVSVTTGGPSIGRSVVQFGCSCWTAETVLARIHRYLAVVSEAA
jgi:hypothetical protein